jgi:hypothetical protein
MLRHITVLTPNQQSYVQAPQRTFSRAGDPPRMAVLRILIRIALPRSTPAGERIREFAR